MTTMKTLFATLTLTVMFLSVGGLPHRTAHPAQANKSENVTVVAKNNAWPVKPTAISFDI
jgi:hypothetical protein